MKAGISTPRSRFLLFALTLFLATIAEMIAMGSTVVAWGSNSQGQSNVPPNLTNAVQVAGGDSFSVALGTDGKVVGWGSGSQTNPPSGLNHVVAIQERGEGQLQANTIQTG